MPSASQHIKTKRKEINYGRQITEIKSEEVLTKTDQGDQRQQKQSAGRGGQTVCGKEKVTAGLRLSLLT
jgi:hypothetical protein